MMDIFFLIQELKTNETSLYLDPFSFYSKIKNGPIQVIFMNLFLNFKRTVGLKCNPIRLLNFSDFGNVWHTYTRGL